MELVYFIILFAFYKLYFIWKGGEAMNVLKGMAAKALEPRKGPKIHVDAAWVFRKTKHTYDDWDQGETFHISKHMVYKPLDCIKKITW